MNCAHQWQQVEGGPLSHISLRCVKCGQTDSIDTSIRIGLSRDALEKGLAEAKRIMKRWAANLKPKRPR